MIADHLREARMHTRSWQRCLAVATLGLLCVTLAAPQSAAGQSSRPAGEWHATGGDHTNTKYSPLDQITGDNFLDLEIAWRWTSISNEVTERNALLIPPNGFKTTPLMVDGLVYLSTSFGQVAALDAGTGELVWSYDAHAYERMGRPAWVGSIAACPIGRMTRATTPASSSRCRTCVWSRSMLTRGRSTLTSATVASST